MYKEVLDTIADSVNPVLVLFVMMTPWIVAPSARKWLFVISLWLRTIFGLILVYVIRFVDGYLGLWSSVGLDYSTHTAFAVCVTTSIVVARRSLIIFLLPLLVVYAMLMMMLEYHTLVDIITTALVIAPLVWLVHQWGKGNQES